MTTAQELTTEIVRLAVLASRYERPDGSLPRDVQDQIDGLRAMIRRHRIETATALYTARRRVR